ncbi:MAG: hypothetical protein HZC55_09285 [Verrucomicrobia bacterium]|nr:hypothetical protein [Verrucomicrobiota bacterium]
MKRFGRTLLFLVAGLSGVGGAEGASAWETGAFRWRASGPLIDVAGGRAAADPHVALKDPTVVFHDGRWHLFGTLRKRSGTVCMQYFAFDDWTAANAASRQEISFTDKYHCAPQVFYFRPHRRWYLIYQLSDPARSPVLAPYCSTTQTLGDAASWSRPQLMVTPAPPKPRWLDFWVICDEVKAHLFYTTLDGHLWRRETRLAEFPLGWSEAVLAIKADIFEASHTYKLKGRPEYLTIIEAQAPGRRYYMAYLADRLEGPWRPLADSLARPFTAQENVEQSPVWTASISHGELLRAGIDERLEVDPENLRFLFQGASEPEYRGSGYGGIPWRLGLLEQR